MLSIAYKQKTKSIIVYLDTKTINVKKSNNDLESFIILNKITARANTPTIYVYDNTYIYVEPFIYVDGGLYDSEGTLVDAGYYDTALWAVTYNGGYS